MNLTNSFRAVFFKLVALVSAPFKVKSLCRKVVSLVLLLSLLALPIHSLILNQYVAFASDTFSKTVAPVGLLPNFLKWLFKSKPAQRRKETITDRTNAVAKLQISPNKFVAYQGQTLKFNALPLNRDDQVIQGVKLSWESSDPNKLQIDDSGKAIFLQPGMVQVTGRAGLATASVAVQIRLGNRPLQSDDEWKNDQRSVTSGSTTTGSILPNLMKQLIPTVEAQGGNGGDLAYDELYSDAKNLVGSPANRIVEATRIGATLPEGSNAEFAVPLVALGGRGVGTNITLFYNSRVWTRRSNSVAFDAVNGEPSPGFSLGFGRIVYYQSGSNYKLIWVETDGTRHYLGQGSYYSSQTYATNDNSDITFYGSLAYGGTLTYPNGASITIQALNNRLLPTQILDKNGNYISIAYKDSSTGFSPLALDYVTDTLGRVIQFNYDASFHLTSIDAPGLGGTSQAPVTTTIARFDYQTVNVTTNFSGLTIERSAANSTSSFLKHIYFPATNNGYLFTYSGYGNMYNVSLRRGMSINQGTIADGTENANVAFNYPTSGATSLSDVPTFTQRTESAVNATTATYTYYRVYYTDAVIVDIVQPNGTILYQSRYTDTAAVGKGLLYYVAIVESDWATFHSKMWVNYLTDGGGKVRVSSITGYDDTNTPTDLQPKK